MEKLFPDCEKPCAGYMKMAKLVAEAKVRIDCLTEFVEEVRRRGDTRLASMAIAVLARSSGSEEGKL